MPKESDQQKSLLRGDEATGLNRLVQAFECTMWSNMVQKKQVPIANLDGIPRFDSMKESESDSQV